MTSQFASHGFVKIRRGLREHLWRMSGTGAQLYLLLHLCARWKGPDRGTIVTSYVALAEELGCSLSALKRAMAKLQPRYVKIVQCGNQHAPTIIRILRYDKRAGIKNDTGSDTSNDTTTNETINKTLVISTPKKAVEDIRSKAKAAAAAKDSATNLLQPPEKPQTDSRFHPIVDEYFNLSRSKGIEPPFDDSDGKQLKNWLKQHPNTPTEKILATLGHAFQSTDSYPLRPGFRLREFVSHESKYQLGPLHKSMNGKVEYLQSIPARIPTVADIQPKER